MAVDIEAMMCRVLNAALDPTIVSDEVGEPWPMVRVFQVDNQRPGSTQWRDAATLQIEAWGEPDGSKAQTKQLIESALQACYDLDSTTQDEGIVAHVEHDSGPTWLPDPTDRHPRYTATVTVFAHPVVD